MEIPSSFDHHERRGKPATDNQTLIHSHRPEKSKPAIKYADPILGPDPDPDPVSSTLVSPLPRSYARPFPPSSDLNPQPQQTVRYKECQRNHAASSGGHVVDGCGEFMAAGDEGTPESFQCAACDCHRSFHRREIDGEVTLNLNTYGHYNMVTSGKVNSQRNQMFPLPHHHHHVSPVMMSFGGGGPAESSTEDLNKFHQSLTGISQFQQPKKRFRTKFNQEQKEKMQEFADKIGWRIIKQNEEEVQRFCSQINVKRQVFKVWMHNNKQATKKKQM